MKFNLSSSLKSILLASCLFSMMTNAALINRGNGMIYDDVLDVTWLQDANYARTSGFDSDGLVSWTSANTWVQNLNFGGYSDWRLPAITPINGSSFNTGFSFNGTTDRGYNISPNTNELLYMFEINLGNASVFNPNGIFAGNINPAFNASFIDGESGLTYSFENIAASYWNDVIDTPFVNAAWGVNFKTSSDVSIGETALFVSASNLGIWALRDGDVTSTLSPPDNTSPDGVLSEPNALILMSIGLLAFSSVRRKTR
ncbi:DUF1566 domain-containing protein [Glaciecola sp. KUL10]|uniref:DUF1566 domain-containing protein n=1 Tax=Glaciecola sp. (strain KUL10) TaxID=2161813 RepID=UPI000D781A67|nr:DUF1566 domain-containing protein [Glaciecola sp. KUL10]GBL05455.1 hypothetical protein KUL10_27760 [Glaciecola sp. KUL10]